MIWGFFSTSSLASSRILRLTRQGESSHRCFTPTPLSFGEFLCMIKLIISTECFQGKRNTERKKHRGCLFIYIEPAVQFGVAFSKWLSGLGELNHNCQHYNSSGVNRYQPSKKRTFCFVITRHSSSLAINVDALLYHNITFSMRVSSC